MQRLLTQTPPFWMQHDLGVWHVGGAWQVPYWQVKPEAQPPHETVPPQLLEMMPHESLEQPVGTHAVTAPRALRRKPGTGPR